MLAPQAERRKPARLTRERSVERVGAPGGWSKDGRRTSRLRPCLGRHQDHVAGERCPAMVLVQLVHRRAREGRITHLYTSHRSQAGIR